MINIQSIKMIRVILLVFSAVLVSACSPVLIKSDPMAFPFEPGEVPEYKNKTSVTVGNGYDESKIVTLSSFGRGLEGDLQQYTETTVDILTRELEDRSINVREGSDKTVVLHVYNVAFEQGMWVLHTTLQLEAELGNGKKVVTEGDNRSPANAWRSVNGALKRAVVLLMKHPDFIDYIDN